MFRPAQPRPPAPGILVKAAAEKASGTPLAGSGADEASWPGSRIVELALPLPLSSAAGAEQPDLL